MKARRLIRTTLECAGGIAGAALVLGGVLLLVIGISERRPLGIAFAVGLLSGGAVLAFARHAGRIRSVVGAVFLILVIATLAAALFLPLNFH